MMFIPGFLEMYLVLRILLKRLETNANVLNEESICLKACNLKSAPVLITLNSVNKDVLKCKQEYYVKKLRPFNKVIAL